MNGKKVIVPEGENPLKFFRKVRTSDSIIYFHSKLLKWMQNKGRLVYNSSERLIISFENEEFTFNNASNMIYHQLLKIGDKSYAPIRHDKRESIIIFGVE